MTSVSGSLHRERALIVSSPQRSLRTCTTALSNIWSSSYGTR